MYFLLIISSSSATQFSLTSSFVKLRYFFIATVLENVSPSSVIALYISIRCIRIRDCSYNSYDRGLTKWISKNDGSISRLSYKPVSLRWVINESLIASEKFARIRIMNLQNLYSSAVISLAGFLLRASPLSVNRLAGICKADQSFFWK